MAENLENEIESVKKVCDELSLTVVPGHFHRERMPVIKCEQVGPSGCRAYLEVAKTQGLSLVVLEQFEFDEEVLKYLKSEHTEETVEDDLEGGEASELEAEWDEIERKHQKYYGSLYTYMLHWIKEGICYTYEREASWYGQLVQDTGRLKQKLEFAEAESEENEIPELTDKEVEEIASELAHDEFFQKATNRGARRYALKKRFLKIVEEHSSQISEIIDQAKGKFELEIKPELEEALDSQIGELLRSGLTKEQIAKKLRISASRVKRAI